MATMSASRFACLPDDEAADWKAPKSKTKSPAKSAGNDKKAGEGKSKEKTKSKAQQEAKSLQSLAFGAPKKSKNKKKGKGSEPGGGGGGVESAPASHEPSPAPAPSEPSEEWVERDRQQVEDTFTQAMQQAIIESQLEFERKAAADQARTELISNGAAAAATEEELAELTKEERKAFKLAGKQKQTMSLEEFQAEVVEPEVEEPATKPAVYKHPRFRDRAAGEKLVVPKAPRPHLGAPPPPKEPQNFFEAMDVAAVAALTREQMRESFLAQEAAGSESALVANYREKLLDKEAELAVARTEAAALREKLGQAKTRTKKLTEILMQAEMREKTEVLVQVHKLETVRDELSAQLSVTVAEQEQERSLVSALEVELKRAAAAGMEAETAGRLLALIRGVRK